MLYKLCTAINVLSTFLSTYVDYFYRQNKPKNKYKLMGYNLVLACCNNTMLIFDSYFVPDLHVKLHISTEYITNDYCLKK